MGFIIGGEQAADVQKEIARGDVSRGPPRRVDEEERMCPRGHQEQQRFLKRVLARNNDGKRPPTPSER